MSEADEAKLHIKVVINKEKTKVLFAEAGSDFTDILISFLLLPLGTIVKVLKKHYGDVAPVIGSLNTLCDGVANLDSIHFSTAYHKSLLLNPRSSHEDSWKRLRINYRIDPTSSTIEKTFDGVFTKNADSFIITDDLQMMPVGSVINTLSKLNIAITDMDGAETRTVAFGLNEIMALLKESLISRNNPLSAILVCGSQVNLATLNYEQSIQIDDREKILNSNKMVLKVMIQKSTLKLLFAQADTDFINFLFGLLVLPLGRVEWYLGSNAGLKNIDNLHRSLAVDNFDKYVKTNTWSMDNLIKPTAYDMDTNSSYEFSPLNFHICSKNINNHVEGSRMYMVNDDLTVVPMTITSSLSVIDKLKINLSDVTELEVQVGLEEGLSIMKAALTSTTPLTDGLIKPMLKKPKQES